ncbi:MAG: TfoX/Sxy family protein [Rhizobiaceae bacterium]
MDDEAIADLFAGLGPVSIRRMFGGKGVYHRGEIVGIDIFDSILVKGDAETSATYEAAGGERWVYEGKNRPVAMPYWSVPADVMEDMDEMARWARLAYDAALRAKASKAAKPQAKTKKQLRPSR